MSAKVIGMDRLEAKLKAMPSEIKAQVRAANQANAHEFIATIEAIIPRAHHIETHPPLASTLTLSPGRTDTGVQVSIGGPKPMDFAAHLELGHMEHGRHVPAQPFWFPTLRVARKRFSARVSRAINAAIKTFAIG